jgi:hypothetical protein
VEGCASGHCHSGSGHLSPKHPMRRVRRCQVWGVSQVTVTDVWP